MLKLRRHCGGIYVNTGLIFGSTKPNFDLRTQSDQEQPLFCPQPQVRAVAAAITNKTNKLKLPKIKLNSRDRQD